MDIVAIERFSFDSFRKKLEQIVSWADNTSLSPSDMRIEKEWIEGRTLAASLNKVAEVQKLLDSGRIKVTTKE